MTRRATISERLDRFSMPITECGCWLWLGYTDGNGYGSLKVDGKNIKAHRVSWMAYRGPVPNHLNVLHRCDIRSCINPDHLFLGTQTDNMQDMIAKGRKNSLHGEHNPNAKLTVSDVLAIRKSTGTLHALALRFGVGKSTIGYIRSKETWKSL